MIAYPIGGGLSSPLVRCGMHQHVLQSHLVTGLTTMLLHHFTRFSTDVSAHPLSTESSESELPLPSYIITANQANNKNYTFVKLLMFAFARHIGLQYLAQSGQTRQTGGLPVACNLLAEGAYCCTSTTCKRGAASVHPFLLYQNWCKANRQYLLTCKVSRYCLFTLNAPIDVFRLWTKENGITSYQIVRGEAII